MTDPAVKPQINAVLAGLSPGAAGTAPAPVELRVGVRGATGVEMVDLLRDGEVIHAFNPRGAQRLSPQWLRVSWSGPVGGAWDGFLEVMDNAILGAEPYGALHSLHPLGPRRLAWNAASVTEPQGVCVRLQSSHRGELRVQTPRGAVRMPLAQFRGRRLVCAGAEPGDQIELCRLPDLPAPREVNVLWLDQDPGPGAHEYAVRALLADGARGQTEPVRLTVTP